MFFDSVGAGVVGVVYHAKIKIININDSVKESANKQIKNKKVKWILKKIIKNKKNRIKNKIGRVF